MPKINERQPECTFTESEVVSSINEAIRKNGYGGDFAMENAMMFVRDDLNLIGIELNPIDDSEN